jgi:hypothetical protein
MGEIRSSVGGFATRLRREYGASSPPLIRLNFVASRRFCGRHCLSYAMIHFMGQLLLLPSLPAAQVSRFHPAPGALPSDAAAAARGILLALALSTIAWIGIALVVPLLW